MLLPQLAQLPSQVSSLAPSHCQFGFLRSDALLGLGTGKSHVRNVHSYRFAVRIALRHSLRCICSTASHLA